MSVFNEISKDRLVFEEELFFIIEDGFPVSPGHLLIISHEIKKDFFELSEQEKIKLTVLIEKAKSIIEEKLRPDGYNIGMNCGEAAGQSVMHFHCHVIPRYKGDMENPRGGIRHCIEGKGYY